MNITEIFLRLWEVSFPKENHPNVRVTDRMSPTGLYRRLNHLYYGLNDYFMDSAKELSVTNRSSFGDLDCLP